MKVKTMTLMDAVRSQEAAIKEALREDDKRGMDGHYRVKGPDGEPVWAPNYDTEMRFYAMQEAKESLRKGDDIAKGGVKFDEGKTRDELLPPELEEAVATILAFGAKKYAARNWEMGMDWSRPYAASRRHLRNWFARRDFGKGPGKDRDSGYSDLWHAACNLAFLIAYEARGKGNDDRPE